MSTGSNDTSCVNRSSGHTDGRRMASSSDACWPLVLHAPACVARLVGGDDGDPERRQRRHDRLAPDTEAEHPLAGPQHVMAVERLHDEAPLPRLAVVRVALVEQLEPAEVRGVTGVGAGGHLRHRGGERRRTQRARPIAEFVERQLEALDHRCRPPADRGGVDVHRRASSTTTAPLARTSSSGDSGNTSCHVPAAAHTSS